MENDDIFTPLVRDIERTPLHIALQDEEIDKNIVIGILNQYPNYITMRCLTMSCLGHDNFIIGLVKVYKTLKKMCLFCDFRRPSLNRKFIQKKLYLGNAI